MRIGIIAMGRSGGYNLGQWISSELGYSYKHEPYWNGIHIDKSSVTKYNMYEVFEGNIKTEFDKTIGLYRNDLRECVISHIRAEESGEWHVPYTITTEWIEERERLINGRIESLKEYLILLKEIPTIECWITYEGIYQSGKDIQKVLKYLDIKAPKYLHLLDSSNRLRKDKRNKPKRLI